MVKTRCAVYVFVMLCVEFDNEVLIFYLKTKAHYVNKFEKSCLSYRI